MEQLVNSIYLVLVLAPAILCWLWTRRMLQKRSASVWTLSAALGLAFAGMVGVFGVFAGAYYLVRLGIVFGIITGISFGAWMIEKPELWRGIGIKSLEPAFLQGEVRLGWIHLRRTGVFAASVYFLVIVVGYWIGDSIIYDHSLFDGFPSKLWIVPVAVVAAVSMLLGQKQRRA